jgi:hypothetical protein
MPQNVGLTFVNTSKVSGSDLFFQLNLQVGDVPLGVREPGVLADADVGQLAG